MIIARVYALLWAIVGAAAIMLYLTGSLSNFTTVILGFCAHALAGAGILIVVPSVLFGQKHNGKGETVVS